jgi:hypothetical protein
LHSLYLSVCVGYSVAGREIDRIGPGFRAVPFTRGGRFPLVLPFDYSDLSSGGRQTLRDALPVAAETGAE